MITITRHTYLITGQSNQPSRLQVCGEGGECGIQPLGSAHLHTLDGNAVSAAGAYGYLPKHGLPAPILLDLHPDERALSCYLLAVPRNSRLLLQQGIGGRERGSEGVRVSGFNLSYGDKTTQQLFLKIVLHQFHKILYYLKTISFFLLLLLVLLLFLLSTFPSSSSFSFAGCLHGSPSRGSQPGRRHIFQEGEWDDYKMMMTAQVTHASPPYLPIITHFNPIIFLIAFFIFLLLPCVRDYYLCRGEKH